MYTMILKQYSANHEFVMNISYLLQWRFLSLFSEFLLLLLSEEFYCSKLIMCWFELRWGLTIYSRILLQEHTFLNQKLLDKPEIYFWLYQDIQHASKTIPLPENRNQELKPLDFFMALTSGFVCPLQNEVHRNTVPTEVGGTLFPLQLNGLSFMQSEFDFWVL